MNEGSAVFFCPKCGMRVDVNANFCPNCGFKLPKMQGLNVLKILEVRGDHGVVEISDIRVMKDGRGIIFTICPLQALIKDCHVELHKILPEPVEKKLLKGLISIRKEGELLGDTEIEVPAAEGLEPLKRYRVCLYTKEEGGEETYEEDVVHIASTFTGKTIEKGFRYAITISGTMIFGKVLGGHPMTVGAEVGRDFSVEYIFEY
jgi:hypothetical protein